MMKNGIKILDMTPVIKTDVFVNDDYKGAVVTNLACYIKYKNKDILKKRARELLDSKKELTKVYKP